MFYRLVIGYHCFNRQRVSNSSGQASETRERALTLKYETSKPRREKMDDYAMRVPKFKKVAVRSVRKRAISSSKR